MGLSVVVACHDVAEFLPACLDSLLAQQVPPDQVILVDDGSTDATSAICAEYAQAHAGWQVVTGPGSGPGGARTLGLEHVTHEYLAFVVRSLPPEAVVAEPIEVAGELFRLHDLLILRSDPKDYRRLEP